MIAWWLATAAEWWGLVLFSLNMGLFMFVNIAILVIVLLFVGWVKSFGRP